MSNDPTSSSADLTSTGSLVAALAAHYHRRVFGTRSGIVPLCLHYVQGSRAPQLFALTVALFILDLVIPDIIPMIDELLLGLAAMFLASWRKGAVPGGRGRRVA